MSVTPTRPVSRDPRPRRIGWRTRDILRAAALVAAVYIAMQLLWLGRSVFLLGFLGVLFGITLAAGVDRLERYRIPRGLGAVLLVLLVLGALVGLGSLAAPQISRQTQEIREQLPEAIERVRGWVEQRIGGVAEVLQGGAEAMGAEGGQEGAAQGDQARGDQAQAPGRGQAGDGPEGSEAAPNVGQGIVQQLSGAAGTFFSFFSSTVSVLAGLVVTLFVAIFVATDPGLYHKGLMHLFPHRARAKAGEVLSATATTLRRWLLMQLIAMVLIGAVTTGALLLLDVKGAIALGLIAGLLEFIPYVGPIVSAIPAIAMALLESPEKALWVALAYTAIQQLEGVVIQPLLMKEGLELPPVLTILGQALFSIVFGFMGLLLAVPLLATVMVPVKMLYVRDVVGDEVTVPGQEDDT
ncbi:MAG TPA: AI-2E family transporter [Gemmatimonadales bacterium]